jgi:hypothetical protein
MSNPLQEDYRTRNLLQNSEFFFQHPLLRYFCLYVNALESDMSSFDLIIHIGHI